MHFGSFLIYENHSAINRRNIVEFFWYEYFFICSAACFGGGAMPLSKSNFMPLYSIGLWDAVITTPPAQPKLAKHN